MGLIERCWIWRRLADGATGVELDPDLAAILQSEPTLYEVEEYVPASLHGGAVHALARIAAGPHDGPYSEPWSRAEALIALDRMGVTATRHHPRGQ